MKPLRTLSASAMEARLRQNVRRTSSKKRKALQCVKQNNSFEKENIFEDPQNINLNSNYIFNDINQNIFNKKTATTNNNYNNNSFQSSRNALFKINENDFNKQVTGNVNFRDLKIRNRHAKLRRLSQGNDNITESLHKDYKDLVVNNKRRRLSLPHTINSNLLERNINDTVIGNLNNINITYNDDNNDGSNILLLNSTNLELIQERLNQDETLHEGVTPALPDGNDSDVNNIWCKYSNHKKLEKMDSGGSSTLSTCSSMSTDTSLSSAEFDPVLSNPSENTEDGESCQSDPRKLSSKSIRVRKFQTRVRDSFKGLQRISSFSKPKLPISRSRSGPPDTTTKSSFKSYIFTEPLTHSASCPASTPSVYSATPHHRPLGPSSSLYANIRPTLHDIFHSHPEIAEQFAIMFPRDPKPEWHKSLKVVIQKSALKLVGKPPETEDNTIPEHLKYQLKQIYVY